MAGDKLIDLECGWNAGVKKSILVRTGYGAETERAAADKFASAVGVRGRFERRGESGSRKINSQSASTIHAQRFLRKLIYVRHHRIRRQKSGLAHPAGRVAAAGISRLRQRGRRRAARGGPARAQKKGSIDDGLARVLADRSPSTAISASATRAGPRTARLRTKIPIRTLIIRQNRRRPQRRHRKLRRASSKASSTPAQIRSIDTESRTDRRHYGSPWRHLIGRTNISKHRSHQKQRQDPC